MAVNAALCAQPPSLRLQKTIPLPDVKGRIDHMSVDVKGQRLFVAALGSNAVEVVDLQSGKVTHTIGNLTEPQGVLYDPATARLWIANGSDGSVRIFDGQTFQLLRRIELGDDADNIRKDAASGQILVGYGSGGIAFFNPDGNKIADIKLDAHPESFQIDKTESRIFVNLPGSQKVAVLSRTTHAVVADWTTDNARSNFPMALDEPDDRLFVVCRRPAVLLVLDTRSGTIITRLPTVGDSDDVFYDQRRKALYVSGGAGTVIVYQQINRDHYSQVARIETVEGARTSLFVPEQDRFFLAIRQQADTPAAIRVYGVGR